MRRPREAMTPEQRAAEHAKSCEFGGCGKNGLICQKSAASAIREAVEAERAKAIESCDAEWQVANLCFEEASRAEDAVACRVFAAMKAAAGAIEFAIRSRGKTEPPTGGEKGGDHA